MKFRKKPIEIEAMQFTDENKDQVYAWAKEYQMNVHHGWDDGKPCLRVPTLEGEMTCSLGDYLIVEPFPTDWRKLYPCKPDIFENTYDRVWQTITNHLKSNTMQQETEETFMVYELDFGDTNLLSEDKKDITEWINNDMQEMDLGSELEYKITIRMMTRAEIQAIPEWS